MQSILPISSALHCHSHSPEPSILCLVTGVGGWAAIFLSFVFCIVLHCPVRMTFLTNFYLSNLSPVQELTMAGLAFTALSWTPSPWLPRLFIASLASSQGYENVECGLHPSNSSQLPFLSHFFGLPQSFKDLLKPTTCLSNTEFNKKF